MWLQALIAAVEPPVHKCVELWIEGGKEDVRLGLGVSTHVPEASVLAQEGNRAQRILNGETRTDGIGTTHAVMRP